MKLARYFGRKLGLKTGVLPRAALPTSAFNKQREQYVAEQLIELLHRPVGDPRVVIGLTAEDMYTRDTPDSRYTFSIRDPHGFAVVSRARMDPRVLGLASDPGLRMRRLQKMVMKNIGVLVFGHTVSANPRSALYNSILGPDDLDFMTEEFRPLPPSGGKKPWLDRSARVCKRGIAAAKALTRRSLVATRADLLAYAGESIALADRRHAELAAIPVPTEDRAAIRALLARFARAVRADRVKLASLSARWSDAVLRSWVQEELRMSLALKSNALELGSRDCARYFDPATYTR